MNLPKPPTPDIAGTPSHVAKTCTQSKPKRRRRRASYKDMLGKALKPASRKIDATSRVLSIEPTGAFSKLDRI